MDTETLKRCIDENVQSAKLSLQFTCHALKEASDIASGSSDKTLNKDILRDYHHIVSQLLEQIDLWKIPVG